MCWVGESLAAVAEVSGLKKAVKPCEQLEGQWEHRLPEGFAGYKIVSL